MVVMHDDDRRRRLSSKNWCLTMVPMHFEFPGSWWDLPVHSCVIITPISLAEAIKLQPSIFGHLCREVDFIENISMVMIGRWYRDDRGTVLAGQVLRLYGRSLMKSSGMWWWLKDVGFAAISEVWVSKKFDDLLRGFELNWIEQKI